MTKDSVLKALLTLALLSVIFFFHVPLQAAAPSNDHIVSAQVIDFPYNDLTLNIEQATVEPNEPLHSCSGVGGSTGLNTVWFQFTLLEVGTIRAGVDESGSSYLPNNDTIMSIYTSALAESACNDDTSPQSLFSFIRVDLPPGTYYLKVSNGATTALQSASTLLLNITFTSGIYPTVTPTLPQTNTPAVTSTDSMLTPTFALTATPAPPELIRNGGFEVHQSSDSIPDDWTPKSLSSDKHICNKPGKIVAYAGECSFQFKGSPGEKSQLKQELSGVQAGDRLTLSAAIHTAYTGAGKVVYVKLRYADDKDQLKIELPEATEGYAVFTQSLIVRETPIKFSVSVRFRGISGKMRVDAVSLTRSSPELRLPE